MIADFSWTIRIYYEDTDAGGIVYYANYLKFFERARTEWLRGTGISQQAMAENDGTIFVVKNSAVEYHAPARLDDELKLTVTVERLGRASVQFFQQAWRVGNIGNTQEQPNLLATSRIRVGCVGLADFRPVPMPSMVLTKIRRYQAGAAPP